MSVTQKELDILFTRSIYDLALEKREDDESFRELIEKHSKLFDFIDEKLGKEDGRPLFRLEELQNEIASTESELVYLKGMIDCAVFLKLIRMI